MERAMIRLRRVLSHQVSIGAVIEIALYLALPHLAIGLGWATLHPEQVQRIQARIERFAPDGAGADLAAWGLTVALWPAAPQIAAACPAG